MPEQTFRRQMAKRAPKLTIRSLRLQNFDGPLHRRIYFALREQILRGDFQDEERLPSSRTLAKSLRVSRNTILAAYDRLADQGYVVARIGAGTRVRTESARQAYVAIKRAAPAQIRSKLTDIFKHARYRSAAQCLTIATETPSISTIPDNAVFCAVLLRHSPAAPPL